MTAGNRAGKAFAAAALLFAADSARALSIDVATALRMSLDSSADLLSLEDQVSAAVLSLKLGLRDCFPQLSLGYLDSTNIVTGGPDATSIQWTVTVRQPLFDGGRFLGGSADSRKPTSCFKGGPSRTKGAEIIDAVDSAYHRVLMLERKLALQKDTLAITDQELEIARAQYGLGGIREIDLMESELQRSSLDISILSSEADLEESEFNLKQLLGLRSEVALVLVDDFDAGYGGMDLPADPRLLEALVLEGNSRGRGSGRPSLGESLAAIIEARPGSCQK